MRTSRFKPWRAGHAARPGPSPERLGSDIQTVSPVNEGILHIQGANFGLSLPSLIRAPMSEKSAPGDPITADAAPAPVEVARPRLKAKARVQDWYRARIV